MRRQEMKQNHARAGRGSQEGTAVLDLPEEEPAAHKETKRARYGTAVRRPTGRGPGRQFDDAAAVLKAIRKSQAVIEFDLDGTILDANENFLNVMGYTLDEIKGRHHSMFVEEAYRRSAEYKEFWAALNRGEYQAAEYKRIGKGGKEVWIQASYNPILGLNGKPFKVVKYATDLTAEKLALNAMIADVNTLAQAVLDGRLATRVDASRHEGEYRKIVEGFNRTLDLVVQPLNAGASYMRTIAKGEIPPRYDDDCKGDFEEIKSSINACIDALGGLAAINGILQNMAKNDFGQTSDDKLPGVYGDLARSLNLTGVHVRHVIEILGRVSHGDLNDLPDLEVLGRRGERDELLPAIISMMKTLAGLAGDAEMLADATAQGKLNVRADYARHEGEYRKIVEGFDHTLDLVIDPLKLVAQNTSALASSSEEMAAVSQQMAGNAEETAKQANVVSAASEQISRNVASVAAATEQMQSSIREIAKNAGESARVAKNAVNVAQSANQTVSKLGDSSQEIGNVIKVITSIAQQTNLLALNATIEAARAGEAGKGFAVVANEVKELAKQTAKATEDIGRKIETIQGDTKGAVSAIEEIGSVINQVNDISNSIATAVEEQTVTTNEIGRSVGEAAKGVDEIAHNIGGVAAAAKDTTQGASNTQKASQELSRMAAQLQAAISKFTF